MGDPREKDIREFMGYTGDIDLEHLNKIIDVFDDLSITLCLGTSQ